MDVTTQPTRTGSAAVVAGLLLSGSAAAYEVTPPQPVACEPVSLLVRHTFSADCRWRVEADVELRDMQIAVSLRAVAGSQECDGAFIDAVFDVGIGRFPAGDYKLVVAWADAGDASIVPMKVMGGTRANAQGCGPE